MNKCQDDADDVSISNAPAVAKQKPPKRKSKFKRSIRTPGSNTSKKQRREQRFGAAGAAAAPAGAPAEDNDVADVQPAAIATPTPSKRLRTQQYSSQQIQKLERKAEGFFNECVEVKNDLADEKAKTEQMQQELQQLRQQLINEKNMHEDKVNELKDLLSSEKTAHEKVVNELEEQIIMVKSACEKDIQGINHTHKLKTDKLNNLLQSQQQRYKTKLSSTIDDANKKLEEANELKLEAQDTIRAAHKDAERVIVNERNHSTHVQKRLKEKHQNELMAVIKSTTTNKRRNNNGEIDEEIVDEEVDDELVDEEVEAVDNTLEREREQKKIVDELKAKVDELKAKVKALEQIAPKVIQKKWIKNPNGKKGGTQAWPHHVVLLIMEWLSNRTPPSCIAANIVSLCSIIMPSADIALELPTTPYIRTVRSLLVVVTKTLAAYTVAKVPRFHQIFTDGTTRRQTELINMLIGYVTDEGLKIVTLDNMIISPEKKSLSTAQALMQSMENAQKLLKGWREVTKELYPDDEDILALIPLPEAATLTKARDAYITTDTCSQAKNVRTQMIKAIKDLAVKEGICDNAEQFRMHELDCWNHLRNLWIEHGVNTLEKRVKTDLAEDLLDIHKTYRVDVDMNLLLRSIDKEFALTANYAKGHGSMFAHWMEISHPGALLFPTARMLGGTRQDAVTEGALPAYMNRHYCVEFLFQQLCAGTTEANILQTSLFIQLTSIEIVAMLRVLSIVHIAIVKPIRFLSGKCHDLDGWGISKMPKALDILYEALKEIVADGSKLLDEDFAMGIFKSLESEVPMFKDYMTHIHEQKEMYVVGDRTKESRKVGMEEARMELFTPTTTMNRQTTRDARKHAEIFAAGVLDVLTNEKMTTKDYLSAASGKYSVQHQSEARAAASDKLAATNDASEGGHAASTAALKTCGTIRFDHAGAEGQSRANNDFGRGHERLVASRKKKSEDEEDENYLGTFHRLPEKLQISLLVFAQRLKESSRNRFTELLKEQQNAAKMKDDLALQKKLDNEKKQFVTNLYLWEEYNRPRCWKDVATAQEEYNKLSSNAAKMKEVRNQILIRYLGLGWVKAHHPWSKNGREYTHAELFDHLINTVIPLSQTETVPENPPFKLPELPAPAQLGLGQLTHDRVSLENQAIEGGDELIEQGYEERDQNETEGRGSKFEEWQRTSMPTINTTFKNFRIEFLFNVSYDNSHDEESDLVWMSGEVIEIVNAKKNKVKIRWDEKWLTEGEDPESVQVLLKSLWNKNKAGAWREHFLVE